MIEARKRQIYPWKEDIKGRDRKIEKEIVFGVWKSKRDSTLTEKRETQKQLERQIIYFNVERYHLFISSMGFDDDKSRKFIYNQNFPSRIGDGMQEPNL